MTLVTVEHNSFLMDRVMRLVCHLLFPRIHNLIFSFLKGNRKKGKFEHLHLHLQMEKLQKLQDSY